MYLAFKFHQNPLPKIGHAESGVTSEYLETLLDEFYTKTNSSLGVDTGKVCQIFSEAFKPRHSHDQNNWRDFFRYALGVSCLASEELLATDFVGQPRSDCPNLIKNKAGDFACRLHPKQTKYIRGLEKPKFLHWKLSGAKGTYKLVDLDDPQLIESVRPFSTRVPLAPLINALYFGAPWTKLKEVSIDRFVSDFHFESRHQVEYLFASDIDQASVRREVARAEQEIEAATTKPFVLRGEALTSETTVERVIRDRAFKEAVRKAYDYSCAVCRLRVDSPDGKWEVQAAHVYPKRFAGADDIRNGVALCHNHHWQFDEHIFTIDENYRLRWNDRIKKKDRVEGEILLPKNRSLWPNQAQAITWHRKTTYELWKKAKSNIADA